MMSLKTNPKARAYAKLLRAMLALAAALFEFVTEEKAPSYRDVLAEDK